MGAATQRATLVLTLPRPTLIIVAIVSIVRVFIAFHVPLTEDESYYWTWSRHLAFGYVDHPPMVAWLIALSSPFGSSPGVIRLPFIACEAIAALALVRTTLLLGGDGRAATAAAVAFTAIPQIRLAIGEALPDGPYLACWALALCFAASTAARPNIRDSAFLGLALGGALLSRFFGWALLLGIVAFALAPQRRALWRNGLWLSLAVAFALYAPFVVWNAQHGWVNFTFTVRDRQSFQAFSLGHATVLSTTRFLIYAGLLWVIGFFVALRPRRALVAWTALPFPAFLAALSFFETIESYWLLGPFTSLCVGIGLAYARLARGWRIVLVALTLPAFYTTAAALFLTLPEATQGALLRSHGNLRAISSSVYTYRPFSDDVRRLAATRNATLMTDQFELASELAYFGVDAEIIGTSPQVGQWQQWHRRQGSGNALVLTVEPLDADWALRRRLALACDVVHAAPTLQYSYAGQPAPPIYANWCRGLRPQERGVPYSGLELTPPESVSPQ